jgi:hypothetical protein
LNGRHACRIDHAFVSRHFRVIDSRFVAEFLGERFVGAKGDALSDHSILLIELGRVAADSATSNSELREVHSANCLRSAP